MSKLIVTSIDNGKISYVEGEEVVTTVEDIESRVFELRSKIAKSRSTSFESAEKGHLEALDQIEKDHELALSELNQTKLRFIEEENRRYEDEKASILSEPEIEAMEREEAKLSLVLGGLRAHSPVDMSEQPEVDEEPDVVEEKVEVEELEEIKPSSEPLKPKRIIF